MAPQTCSSLDNILHLQQLRPRLLPEQEQEGSQSLSPTSCQGFSSMFWQHRSSLTSQNTNVVGKQCLELEFPEVVGGRFGPQEYTLSLVILAETAH